MLFRLLFLYFFLLYSTWSPRLMSHVFLYFYFYILFTDKMMNDEWFRSNSCLINEIPLSKWHFSSSLLSLFYSFYLINYIHFTLIIIYIWSHMAHKDIFYFFLFFFILFNFIIWVKRSYEWKNYCWFNPWINPIRLKVTNSQNTQVMKINWM